MKTLIFAVACGIGTFSAQAQTQAQAQTPTPDLTQYVNPLIGSGGHGHVFVGASVPFGAVQVGPQNIPKGWDWCSGYHYSDSIITGFSHLHLSGTGGGDLGDVLIMPYTGAIKTDKGTQEHHQAGYSSLFQHKNEKVTPGYYRVHLDDDNIDVELTASERVGFHRYHFENADGPNRVIIDLKEGIDDKATDTYIEQTDDHTIRGYRYSRGWARDQRVFFALQSDQPITDFKVYNDSVLLDGTKGRGTAIKGLITTNQQTLQLKVGISPVSMDNAQANIAAEIPGWDFQKTVEAAKTKWNKELDKIEVRTANETDKRVFYTALYHTMIDPTLYNDHNGDYLGTDKKVYPHARFQNYTVFSLWDTYRALQPLYTLIQPERVNDIVQSMLAIYQQQGKLPVWHLEGCETNTMPGVSGVQVVAEAFTKGFRGFDTALAWQAVYGTTHLGSFGMNYDQRDQYIPCDKVRESVAKALEYGVSNASVALMAKQMGRTADYAYYHERAKNYRKYWDPATGFFRGKRADGSWNPVFDPVRSSHPWIDDLSEGNHWQYLWLVPEDVEGLKDLIGGETMFIKRLDSLFTIQAPPDPNAPPDIAGLIGQYAHGDEPGHHPIYLYAFAGQQWKTAEKARFITQNLYRDSVDGLSGNEDCGQMSAWYVM
jgi:predicted alpha-1,2-mannosidase